MAQVSHRILRCLPIPLATVSSARTRVSGLATLGTLLPARCLLWGLVLAFGLDAALPAVGQMSLHQANLLRSHGVILPPVETATTQAPIAPPLTTEDALEGLASQAGLIFVGQVTDIHPGEGFFSVEFRVEDGIRGVATGASCAIREIAVAQERYNVGQRALFLFRAPSALGFTSPVGGEDGILPVAGDGISGTVDLRWVAARIRRKIGTQAASSSAQDLQALWNGADLLPSIRAAADLARGIETGSSQEGMASAQTELASQSQPSAPVSTVGTGAGNSGDGDAGNLPGQESNPGASGNVTGLDVHAIDRNLVAGLLRAWSLRNGGSVEDAK